MDAPGVDYRIHFGFIAVTITAHAVESIAAVAAIAAPAPMEPPPQRPLFITVVRQIQAQLGLSHDLSPADTVQTAASSLGVPLVAGNSVPDNIWVIAGLLHLY